MGAPVARGAQDAVDVVAGQALAPGLVQRDRATGGQAHAVADDVVVRSRPRAHARGIERRHPGQRRDAVELCHRVGAQVLVAQAQGAAGGQLGQQAADVAGARTHSRAAAPGDPAAQARPRVPQRVAHQVHDAQVQVGEGASQCTRTGSLEASASTSAPVSARISSTTVTERSASVCRRRPLAGTRRTTPSRTRSAVAWRRLRVSTNSLGTAAGHAQARGVSW